MHGSRPFFSTASRTALLTSGVFFAAGLMLAAIGPSLPVLAVRIGVDVAALGGLFTLFSAGVMIAQVGVVPASRRFGQPATLTASALLMSVGGLAIAQSGGLWVLFAAALLGGLGFGGVLATGNTLVAQLFPARSAAALNGLNLFFGVGSIVGPVVAAAANARFGMPQLTLWLGAGAMALLAPVLMSAEAAGAGEAGGQQGAGRVGQGRPWLFGLLLLIYTGTEIGLGAWLTLYMITSASMEPTRAALVVSGFWLALTTGRGLAILLGMRLRPSTLLGICLGGLLLGAALLALGVGSVVVTCVGALVFGLSCGPVFPTVLAIVASRPDGRAAASRVLVLGNSGALVIPALIGLLLTRVGAPAVAALLVIAALLMIGLGTAALRPSPSADGV